MESSHKTSVSIIVPVYNALATIDRCIRSIINQTFADFELILVDDGSPDSSGAICDEMAYSDSRIRVLHQKNEGVSSARNNGMAQARGTWITFIDSDDWVGPDYLERLMAPVLADASIDMVIGGIRYYFVRKNKYSDMFRYTENKYSLINGHGMLIRDGILKNGCPVAKLFSKRIITNNNLSFDKKISLNEDHLFVVGYIKYTTLITTVDSVDYTYFYDDRVCSLTKRKHSYDEHLNTAILMYDAYKALVIGESDKIENHTQTRIFGFQQILRALEAAVDENDFKQKFNQVCTLVEKRPGMCSGGLNFFEKALSFGIIHRLSLFSRVLISLKILFNSIKKRLKKLIYK